MPHNFESEAEAAAATIFAALGDRTRLAIISHLSDGSDRSVSQLAENSHLTRQGISRHLRVLEEVDLVHMRRIGRESRYQLDLTALNRAQIYLDRAAKQWDQAIHRLSEHLADCSE